MKHQPWMKSPVLEKPIFTETPKGFCAAFFECLYGKHAAELLHRGTAYCRKCYDERNPNKTLIDS